MPPAEDLLTPTYAPQPPVKESEPLARLSIKDWSAGDQPREKFMDRGREAVSDAELLGILLGSGTTTDSAVDVARKVLALAGNSLQRLSKLDWKQFKEVRGVGDARAITIAAALELGRRHAAEAPPKRVAIGGSADVYRHITPYLSGLTNEQFYVLLLSRANQVLHTVRVGEGGISGVMSDQRIIFRHALLEAASAIVAVHNHPSGALRPSLADDELTEVLRQAGGYLNIPLLDHLIYTDSGYYSYKDEGKL